MRSWTKPTREEVSRTLALLGSKARHRYFFSRLNNPEWVSWLEDAGLFRTAPEPLLDEEGHIVSHPMWPEADYLARVAAEKPAEVFVIAERFHGSENVSVHTSFTVAACSLPGELAAKWGMGEIRWIDRQERLLGTLYIKYADLIKYLAQEGEAAAALALAGAVLRLTGKEVEEADFGSRIVHAGKGVWAKVSWWEYNWILQECVPPLAQASPRETLEFLSNLLFTAIRRSLGKDGKAQAQDYSTIWRPNIDSEDARHEDVRSSLVGEIRYVLGAIVEADPSRLEEVVGYLESLQPEIFSRLALDALRRFNSSTPGLLSQHLVNRELFHNENIRAEYFGLLRDRFEELSAEEQALILEWIEDGPDLELYRRRWLEWRDAEPDQDKLDAYAAAWKVERFHVLRNSLPEAQRERYGALAEQLGEPEGDDLSVRLEVVATWGDQNPTTGEELNALDFDALLVVLREFEPSEAQVGQSLEGLGRAFAEAVAAEPERYIARSEELLGLRLNLLKGFLAGLYQSKLRKNLVCWPLLLRICADALVQGRQVSDPIGRQNESLPAEEADKRGVAAQVLEILREGFESGPEEIPTELRELAWDVLKLLAEDDEPTREYEERVSGGTMDPYTLSINTIRGDALNSIVRYALWVYRSMVDQEPGGGSGSFDFDRIPEARAVLERHLDPAIDPSIAVRAVYGRWFPWLVLLDSSWASANVGTIFPEPPELTQLRQAAWVSYIGYCEFYNEVFKILEAEYRFAVENAPALRQDGRINPNERLAEHLIAAYARGLIGIGSEASLIVRFFSVASESLAAHSIAYVGRGLRDKEGHVRGEVLTRMTALWEWRVIVLSGAGVTPVGSKELAAFGWWYSSGKFDPEWAIEALQKTLTLGGKSEPEHLVLERLAEDARLRPGIATNCLRLILDGAPDYWNIYHWKKEAGEVLAAALASDDVNAVTMARALVDRLCELGFLEFRELLKPK